MLDFLQYESFDIYISTSVELELINLTSKATIFIYKMTMLTFGIPNIDPPKATTLT